MLSDTHTHTALQDNPKDVFFICKEIEKKNNNNNDSVYPTAIYTQAIVHLWKC